MKKVLTTALIAGTVFTAGSVFAYGHGYKQTGCQGARMQRQDCPMMRQQQPPRPTAEQLAAMKKFDADTAGLRKQLVMKQAEKRALMKGQNPDAKRVATLAGEIFDLRYTLKLKAQEAGVPMPPMMGPGGRGMKGQGMRGSRMRGQRGPGKGMNCRMMQGTPVPQGAEQPAAE